MMVPLYSILPLNNPFCIFDTLIALGPLRAILSETPNSSFLITEDSLKFMLMNSFSTSEASDFSFLERCKVSAPLARRVFAKDTLAALSKYPELGTGSDLEPPGLHSTWNNSEAKNKMMEIQNSSWHGVSFSVSGPT